MPPVTTQKRFSNKNEALKYLIDLRVSQPVILNIEIGNTNIDTAKNNENKLLKSLRNIQNSAQKNGLTEEKFNEILNGK